jgi:hypothetical protein
MPLTWYHQDSLRAGLESMGSSEYGGGWDLIQKLPDEPLADLKVVADALAQIFQVQWHEVALLRIRGNNLEFIFPRELNAAGAIPLSSSAIAARTATSQKAALFNDFTKVVHHSVFEVVPLTAPKNDFDPQRIHKLMSAAVVNRAGRSVGVVQISRKGPSRDAAGPDFTEADLRQLEIVTSYLAPLLAKQSGQ